MCFLVTDDDVSHSVYQRCTKGVRACDWPTGEAAAIGSDIAKARQTFLLRTVGQVKYPSQD